MGLGVGERIYSEPEQKRSSRSYSNERAHIILWQRRHLNYYAEFEKLKLSIDKAQQRLFSLNETFYKLQTRISCSKCPKLYLIASHARVSNCKKEAKRQMDECIKARDSFAWKITEWEALPLLDAQIAQARQQRRG